MYFDLLDSPITVLCTPLQQGSTFLGKSTWWPLRPLASTPCVWTSPPSFSAAARSGKTAALSGHCAVTPRCVFLVIQPKNCPTRKAPSFSIRMGLPFPQPMRASRSSSSMPRGGMLVQWPRTTSTSPADLFPATPPPTRGVQNSAPIRKAGSPVSKPCTWLIC